MNALITGSAGFIGSHLIKYLISKKYKVWSFDINSAEKDILNNRFEKIDYRNKAKVEKFIKKARPNIIFHFIGLYGINDYKSIYDINLFSTITLLNIIHKIGLDCKIIVSSSSSIYGVTNIDDNPLNEEMPFMPINHYSSSKISQEIVCMQYHLQKNMKIMRVRSFNLLGPKMPALLFASSVSKQIVEIEISVHNKKIKENDVIDHLDKNIFDSQYSFDVNINELKIRDDEI